MDGSNLTLTQTDSAMKKINGKTYYTRKEVIKALELPHHVLRHWEGLSQALKSSRDAIGKDSGGNYLFSDEYMRIAGRLKELVYFQKLLPKTAAEHTDKIYAGRQNRCETPAEAIELLSSAKNSMENAIADICAVMGFIESIDYRGENEEK